jgi:hypothetical protein
MCFVRLILYTAVLISYKNMRNIKILQRFLKNCYSLFVIVLAVLLQKDLY